MSTAHHAVVLSGGGANGAYEVGVMEALFTGRWKRGRRGPVSASVFTGTSVGSFNAAAMVSLSSWGWPAAVRELREIWLERVAQTDGRPNGVFRLRKASLPHEVGELAANWLQRGVDLAFSEESPGRRLLRSVDFTDLISTAPLKTLIDDTIDEQRILHTNSKLRIVASDWDTGDPVVFYNTRGRREDEADPSRDYRSRALTQQNAKTAILASTAIPALFPRVTIDGSYFVDGGVVMNTPLTPAIQAGATVLHVIHLESKLGAVPLGRTSSAIESVEGILAATPARLIKGDIRHAKLEREVIQVARRLGRMLKDRPGTVGEDDLDPLRAFVDRYAGWPEVEIHRYFPNQAIGGAIGLLDFRRHRLIDLIELGFQNAVEHDCSRNGCVV